MKKSEQWSICYSGEYESFPEENIYLLQGRIIVSGSQEDSFRLFCIPISDFSCKRLRKVDIISGTDPDKINSFLSKTPPRYPLVFVFTEDQKKKIKEKHDVEVLVLYNGCRYLLHMLFMTYKNGWCKYHVDKLPDAVVPEKPKKVKESKKIKEKKNVNVDVQKQSDDK